MGVATGCGFKEIYRFPHIIIIITSLRVLYRQCIERRVLKIFYLEA